MNKEKSITDCIITNSTGWDELDDGDIQLYNGILQIDTPKFKKGDKVDNVSFIFSKSMCEIIDKDGNLLDSFPIKLIIDN